MATCRSYNCNDEHDGTDGLGLVGSIFRCDSVTQVARWNIGVATIDGHDPKQIDGGAFGAMGGPSIPFRRDTKICNSDL